VTTTDDYATRVHIGASPQRVFEVLTSAEKLASWWSPATGSGAEGGELRITFAGFEDPVIMKVKQATRPAMVVWEVESCTIFPEWPGTRVAFALSDSGSGGCDVQFRHEGLTPRLECYDMCRAGWDEYLPSLRDYIETGAGHPYTGPRQA
jgi:uncharacterized protein YndB with AHSA1/START domain